MNPETQTTEPELTQLSTVVAEIQHNWAEFRTLPAAIKTLRDDNAVLRNTIADLRRSSLASRTSPHFSRPLGSVSDDCARFLTAQFVAHCERSGKLDALCSQPAQRDSITAFARNTLGFTTRAALTSTDITLPVQFSSQLRELISEFGVVRRSMAHYPIGMGTARPARMGVRPAFSSIAMSALIDEKSPTISFASLESHKIGGIVRLPREIDEQSAVPMGQFLARYGAIEFARVEDTWGFLATGSATYETVKGVVEVARDNDCIHALAGGKTKPSDATLDDFRALRTMVNKIGRAHA